MREAKAEPRHDPPIAPGYEDSNECSHSKLLTRQITRILFIITRGGTCHRLCARAPLWENPENQFHLSLGFKCKVHQELIIFCGHG